jgi:hypothetical protein
MLHPGSRLRPNSAEVAAKVIDGEAILINLSNGMYYSMDLAGGVVWQLVEATREVREIVEDVCAHYDVERPRAEADIERLIDELLQARLIEICADDAVERGDRPEAPAKRAAYQAPRLNAYHDMSELLALDPPHPWLSDPLSKPLAEP